ncbi:MAG: GTP-binding protein [Candidatus Helarchaeota archaeon]
MNTDYDYLLKVIIVGDGAVGKTALSVRYTQGKFMDDYKMTIGVDFSVKMLDVDGHRVKLQLWDTGGQERFSYLRPLYYSGAVGGLIVFDKTYRPSFENIPKWFQEVRQNRGPNIPLLLVGNKVDLPDWQVSTEEAVALSKTYKTIYRDVSAKSGKSVDEVFSSLIKMIISPETAKSMLEEEQESSVQQQKLVMNESYNKYNKFAKEASAFLEAGNYVESLNSLKKALYWARDANYPEAVKWCEDNIAYIDQFINKSSSQPKLQKVTEHMYICESCGTYYKVAQIGEYACPECGRRLVKMN